MFLSISQGIVAAYMAAVSTCVITVSAMDASTIRSASTIRRLAAATNTSLKHNGQPSRQAARPAPAADTHSSESYPAGTVLVVHHAGRTYFATESGLEQRPARGRFPVSLPVNPPKSVLFSPNGERLLLVCGTDSFLLRSSDLHLLRRFHDAAAWWEGRSLGYWDHQRSRIFTHGRWGREDIGQTELTGLDPRGRFFLGVRPLRRGNLVPRRLEIWENDEHGPFRLRHTLQTVTFDPGSEENPFRLTVLSSHVATFGFPNGRADGEDGIGILRGRSVTGPLTDGHGHALQFVQSPSVTRRAIVGLAEAGPRSGSGHRYLFRVTATGVTLQAIPSTAVLVTYDPVRGIGVGTSGRGRITVHYGSFSWSRHD